MMILKSNESMHDRIFFRINFSTILEMKARGLSIDMKKLYYEAFSFCNNIFVKHF